MAEVGIRAAARVGPLLVAVFVVLLAILHVLKPEVDPARQLISMYEVGRHGWVMRLAFISLGLGVLALLVGIWPVVPTVTGRIGACLLMPVGAGLVLAGVFAAGPLHSVAGLTVVLGTPIAATLIASSSGRDQGLLSGRRWLLGATLLVWVGFFAFFGPVLAGTTPEVRDSAAIGYLNRFMMAGYCVWLLAISWRTQNNYRRN